MHDKRRVSLCRVRRDCRHAGHTPAKPHGIKVIETPPRRKSGRGCLPFRCRRASLMNASVNGPVARHMLFPAYQLRGQSYALAVFVAACSDGWLLSSPPHQIRLETHKPLILDNRGTTPECLTSLGGIYFPMHSFRVGPSTFRA